MASPLRRPLGRSLKSVQAGRETSCAHDHGRAGARGIGQVGSPTGTGSPGGPKAHGSWDAGTSETVASVPGIVSGQTHASPAAPGLGREAGGEAPPLGAGESGFCETGLVNRRSTRRALPTAFGPLHQPHSVPAPRSRRASARGEHWCDDSRGVVYGTDRMLRHPAPASVRLSGCTPTSVRCTRSPARRAIPPTACDVEIPRDLSVTRSAGTRRHLLGEAAPPRWHPWRWRKPPTAGAR